MIYVTGDMHGDFKRFTKKERQRSKYQLTSNDYVIVLGDFGLVWADNKEFQYNGEWLSKLPFTILFVDGNHDNHDMLASYPVEEWHGGKVHHIVQDKIIHLMRGQIFFIDGMTFFTMGGAESHDIQGGVLDRSDLDFYDKRKRANELDLPYRVLGESWWSQELPNEQEYAEGLRNLAKADFKVDFILSHCTPRDVQEKLIGAGELKRKLEINALTEYFDFLQSKVCYKQWLSGHIHLDVTINSKHTVVYRDFILAEEMIKYGNED